MKILFTTTNAGFGGGEAGIFLIMKELSKNNDVVLLTCKENGKFIGKVKENGISVIVDNFKRKNIIYTIFHSNYISKFDVIHNNSLKTALLFGFIASIFKYNIKNFWTCHGQWYKINVFIKNLINKYICKVFCVSKVVYNNLKNQGINNLVLSYLGIEFEECENKKILHNEFNISDNAIIISVIARFDKIKGQYKALCAFEKLLKVFPRLYIVFIGGLPFDKKNDKNYYLKVVEKAKLINKNIIFAGERDNVPSLIQESDIILIPSDNESLSLVALEGICQHKIVFSTPCDGPKEILNNDKLLISRKNDADSIAYLIQNYLLNKNIQDETKKKINFIREKCYNKYNYKNVLKIYYKCFSDVYSI